MRVSRAFGFTIIFYVHCLNLPAQIIAEKQDTFEIGRICPSFTLHNIKYFSKDEISVDDLRGKWFIMDFWNKDCIACIESFPSINREMSRYQDKVQFMLVGIQDQKNEIQPLYAKYRQKQKLNMPCSFDSLLPKRFSITACPQVIVVDDKGVVRGWVNSLSSDDLDRLLSGKITEISKSSFIAKIHRDPSKPYLMNGNGGNEEIFMLRSILTEFKENEYSDFHYSINEHDIKRGRFEALGVPLSSLYNYAYFGTDPDFARSDTGYGEYYKNPILDLRDSSEFIYSYKSPCRNIYCYSLSMAPEKATKERIQGIMRSDLQNYFGYSVSIEERDFTYLRLVTIGDTNRLKTKGDSSALIGSIHGSFKMINVPIENLLGFISYHFHRVYILDETNIKGNIDLSMDAVMTDMQDVRRSLQKNGLDLITGKRKMKVLVIKDKVGQ